MTLESPGYIKLHRALMESWLWEDINMLRLALTLLFMANWKDKEFFPKNSGKVIDVKRGQLITSLASLKEESMLTSQNIRTSLKNLELGGFLTSQSTNRFRLITIVNYNKYQDVPDELTNKLTSCQQAANKLLTTTKEVKKERSIYISSKDSNQEEILFPAKRVLDHLNRAAGRAFKPTNGSLKHICARLKEGFKESDMISVIDKKVGHWKGDKKMDQYLRPQTLFNSEKFEGYLNEKGVAKDEYAWQR